MKLYLARHGETEWNRMEKMQGQVEIPLNEKGTEVARKTAKMLKQVQFDAAFSSPLSRAYETARIILGDRKVEIVKREELMEIGFGIWEGYSIRKAKQKPEQLFYDFFQKPEAYRPPETAETYEHLYERSGAFLENVILPLENQKENILIATRYKIQKGIDKFHRGWDIINKNSIADFSVMIYSRKRQRRISMRKRVCILPAVVMMFSLAACGSGDGASADTSDTTQVREETAAETEEEAVIAETESAETETDTEEAAGTETENAETDAETDAGADAAGSADAQSVNISITVSDENGNPLDGTSIQLIWSAYEEGYGYYYLEEDILESDSGTLTVTEVPADAAYFEANLQLPDGYSFTGIADTGYCDGTYWSDQIDPQESWDGYTYTVSLTAKGN